jgi:hypothetical protein
LIGAVTAAAVPGCLAVALPVGAGAQTETQPTKVRTQGVGKPPSGAGMGTQAALENPECNPDAVARREEGRVRG